MIQRRPNHEYFYYINAPEPPYPDVADFIPLPIPAQVSVLCSDAFPTTPAPSASIEYSMVRVQYSLKNILETTTLPQQNNTYYYTTAIDKENRDIAEKTFFAEMQPIGARKLTSKAFRRGLLKKHVCGISSEIGLESDITDYEYNIYEDSISHWFSTDFFLLCDNSRCVISDSPWCKNDYSIGRYRLIPYNKTVKKVSKIGSDNVKSTTRYEYFYSQYTDAIDYALVKSKAVSRSNGPEMVSHYTYLRNSGSTALPEVETEIVTIGDDVVGGRRTVYSADKHLPVATYSLGKTGYKKSQLVTDDKFTTEALSKALNRPEYTYRYNQFGRVVEIRYRNRVLASYIWSYHGAYPIVEARGVAYDNLIAGLDETEIYNSVADLNGVFSSIIDRMPDADLTFNAYHNLIGVIESRDSRGGGRFYSYDNFGRLSTTRDYHENILNKYRYVLSQD